MNTIPFVPADILIPKNVDMEKWSVVACDQFSSQPEYWDKVQNFVKDAPSTLHMIKPEAYIEKADAGEVSSNINETMKQYLANGVFETIPDSLIYIERSLNSGEKRLGLVGMLDLEAYDYAKGSETPVRASEDTVVARLPIRIKIREKAPLELPHIMVFINDEKKSVIEPLSEKTHQLKKLYDFDLMEKGGRIKGWRVDGDDAQKVLDALNAVSCGGVQIVIGDGNHSLAAAKEYWKEVKAALSPEEIKNHPARFVLAELNNVYDDSIVFEPIHRVLFNVDTAKLLSELKCTIGADNGVDISCRCEGKNDKITLPETDFGTIISTLQNFLESYIKSNGGSIDYVHGDDAALKMADDKNCISFIMPKMKKADLFKTVAEGKVFSKKSFSVGDANEKRYYLECRKITK